MVDLTTANRDPIEVPITAPAPPKRITVPAVEPAHADPIIEPVTEPVPAKEREHERELVPA